MLTRHRMMMCSTCADKKRANGRLMDAEQIFRQINQCLVQLKQFGYDVEALVPERMNPNFLYEPVHIMCGTCSEIEAEKNRLRLIERKMLDSVSRIYALFKQLQEDDTKGKGTILKMAESFRGYYPEVARMFWSRR